MQLHNQTVLYDMQHANPNVMSGIQSSFSFFFNDTPTTEIYTLSLHDALPILTICWAGFSAWLTSAPVARSLTAATEDRKSTRLNSSHPSISYAVFCLKKKKK